MESKADKKLRLANDLAISCRILLRSDALSISKKLTDIRLKLNEYDKIS